ncbi:hypothetical protein ACFVHW_11585 [Streptomyces sp. NPDC127110]|uniref:hypothetical protein n=1 Tax=Streptomyces sp. NPDC127110 TaxID=3345362 RepID=UPI00362E8129
MAEEQGASDAFRNRCTNAALALQPFVHHSIERISLDESNEDRKDNTLDVWLIAPLFDGEPRMPDVVISLANLYSVRPWEPDLCPSFIDGISLVHLPRLPSPWPAEAAGRLDRTEDLPGLVWLRIAGPLEVDAVAAVLTVYQEQDYDAAPVLR